MFSRKPLAPVVQTLDSAILWINHYPLDNSIGFASVYPLDSNLSGGQRYPSFEQLGPGVYNIELAAVMWCFACFIVLCVPHHIQGNMRVHSVTSRNTKR